MNFGLFISIIIFLISLGYKSEKKKKEQLRRHTLQNKSPITHSVSSSVRDRQVVKSNEQNILEKATQNMKASNLVYEVAAGKEGVDLEQSKNNSTIVERDSSFATVKQPVFNDIMPKTKKSSKKKEEIKDEADFRKNERVEKIISSYHEVFDGFGASDALYLARKDVRESRSFL